MENSNPMIPSVEEVDAVRRYWLKYHAAPPMQRRDISRGGGESGSDGSGSFLGSAVISAVTDSTAAGFLFGGSLTGAIVGDILSND